MTWLKALYGAAATIAVTAIGTLAARNSKTAADRDSYGADHWTPDDPVDARVADCQQTLGIWPRDDLNEPIDVYPAWQRRRCTCVATDGGLGVDARECRVHNWRELDRRQP